MSLEANDHGPTKIVLTREDGGWRARDEGSDLIGRGKTRKSALEALDEAIEQASAAESIPADDPLFGDGSIYASDDPLDETEIDDVLYGGTDR